MVTSLLTWSAGHATVFVAITFPSLLILEYLWRRRRADEIESASMVASLTSAGAFSTAKTILGRALFVGLATVIHEQYRIFDLDTSSLAVWVSIFLLRDLVTYWVHRLEHRVSVFWAAHAVHHIDKNFGALLSIWDRMFGTFEPEAEPVVYGIGEHRLTSVADMFWGGYRDLGDRVRAAEPGKRLQVLASAPGAPSVNATPVLCRRRKSRWS